MAHCRLCRKSLWPSVFCEGSHSVHLLLKPVSRWRFLGNVAGWLPRDKTLWLADVSARLLNSVVYRPTAVSIRCTKQHWFSNTKITWFCLSVILLTLLNLPCGIDLSFIRNDKPSSEQIQLHILAANRIFGWLIDLYSRPLLDCNINLASN